MTIYFCNYEHRDALCGREKGHEGEHGIWTQHNGRPPSWRRLREDESPVAGVGRGPAKMGEICCPDFDTRAPYEMVFVNGLGRVARQGDHVLLRDDRDISEPPFLCACGRWFTGDEAQIRGVL